MTNWVDVGSDRLEEAQEATGLSNERLARRIPVSSKTWERWKKRGQIPASNVPAVAKALGIEIVRPGGPRILEATGDLTVEDRLAELEEMVSQILANSNALVRGQEAVQSVVEEIRAAVRPQRRASRGRVKT